MALKKRGRYWHYYFCVRGRRYRGSTGEITRTAAAEVERNAIAQAKEVGGVAPRRAKTLLEIGERYMTLVAASDLRPKSKLYYQNGWRMLKATALSSMYLDTITADDILILKFTGSPSTANNALRTLKRIFNKAVEWGVIAKRPGLRLKKEVGRELRLDDVAEAKLLPFCSQDLAHAIVIMREGGLRNESEVYVIRWEYCFFEKRVIFNPAGKSSDSRRWIPMTDRIKAVLLERGPQTVGWVFPSDKNPSGHIRSLSSSFQRARRLAGLPNELKLYCARHDYGTVVTETLGLAVAKKAMGHSDLKTTMRYVHPETDKIGAVMNERHKTGHSGPSIN